MLGTDMRATGTPISEKICNDTPAKKMMCAKKDPTHHSIRFSSSSFFGKRDNIT
jgi:hypothetical protein